MKYKYLIFDLDWTLINSTHKILDIIEDYFLENYPDLYDTARYYLENSQWQSLQKQWQSLQKQLEHIFQNKELAEKETKKIYKLLSSLRNKVRFFPWVQEKIEELYNKWYKLFLTTWSSTEFATKTLKDWWIYNYFEKVIWSDEILKWRQHLEIFKEISWDSNFYKKSLYIWDWEMDKIFALESWIDFIRVWNRWEKNEKRIKSIIEINNYL
jgi:FMN phosphatase YigB (HAD superfamily)